MPYQRESSTKRGYGASWRRARDRYLKEHPMCVYHQRIGQGVPASVVDHIIPHKQDKLLFWDVDNWQALCASCHNSIKKIEENGGVSQWADVDGMPIDPNHFWNRKG